MYLRYYTFGIMPDWKNVLLVPLEKGSFINPVVCIIPCRKTCILPLFCYTYNISEAFFPYSTWYRGYGFQKSKFTEVAH